MHFVFSKFRDLSERILFGKHTSHVIKRFRKEGSLNNSAIKKLYKPYLTIIVLLSVILFLGEAILEIALLVCLFAFIYLRYIVITGPCMSRAILATLGVKGIGTVISTQYHYGGITSWVCKNWKIHLEFKSPDGVNRKVSEMIVYEAAYEQIRQWEPGDRVEILYNPYNPKFFFPNFPQILNTYHLKK